MKHLYHFIFAITIVALNAVSLQAQYMKLVQTEASPIKWDTKAYKNGQLLYTMSQSSELGTNQYLTRMNDQGNALWSKKISQEVENAYLAAGYSDIEFDNEDNWIVGGFVTIASGQATKGVVQKMDSLGNVAWTVTVDGEQSAYVSGIEVTDDIIYATITSYSFFSSTFFYKSGVMGISHNGQVLWHKKYAHPTSATDYYFSRTTTASNGDFIGIADIGGSSSAQANGIMITRITSQGEIAFSKYYDFTSTHSHLSANGLAVTDNDEIIFGGRLMTDQSSIYPNTMWLAKLDAEGDELIQKTYSAGEDCGEQLSGLQFANGKLYAGILLYAPFADLNRAVIVAEIDTDDLSIAAYDALDQNTLFGDVYGQSNASFDIAENGSILFAGALYCPELSKSISVSYNFSSSLSSGCEELERTIEITDEVSVYPQTNYVPGTSVTYTFGTQPAIQIEETTSLILADLCAGCDNQANSIAMTETSFSSLTIYPNPATNELFAFSSTPDSKTFYIRDTQGRLVLHDKFSNGKSINTSTLNAGVYFISVGSDTQRLIIQ